MKLKLTGRPKLRPSHLPLANPWYNMKVRGCASSLHVSFAIGQDFAANSNSNTFPSQRSMPNLFLPRPQYRLTTSVFTPLLLAYLWYSTPF